MNSQYIYGQSSTDRNYNVNGTSISEWLYMWYGPTTGPLSQEAPSPCLLCHHGFDLLTHKAG